jgi:DNA helicase MCM9
MTASDYCTCRFAISETGSFTSKFEFEFQKTESASPSTGERAVHMAEFLVSFDPKSLAPEQYRRKFVEFVEQYELDQLQKLLLRNCTADEHYSFEVAASDLVHYDSALSYSLLHHPRLLIPIFKEAVLELQYVVHQHPAFQSKHGQKGKLKTNLHVRIISLPSVSDLSKSTIGDVRSHEVSSLIQVTGTVVRTSGVRMLELSKQYECMNPKCRYRFTVTADPEQDHMLPQPRSCPSKVDGNAQPRNQAAAAGGRGAGSKPGKCNSVNLREIEGSRVCVDYQEIKIQDHVERLGLGSVPRSIIVILQADLVDRFNPGDDVVVVGTIVRRWRPVVRGVRCTVDIALEANSVVAVNAAEQTVSLSDITAAEFEQFWRTYRETNAEFQTRNAIVRSVCPQLYGMFPVKLALLLALIGGSSGAGSLSSNSTIGPTSSRSVAPDATSDLATTTVWGPGSDGGADRDGAATAADGSRGVHRRSQIHMLMVSSLRL